MTNKEAIEMIRDDMRLHHDHLSGTYRKALNMAISALEKLDSVPSARPESTRTFVGLVVKYTDPVFCAYKEYKGKPYYSIKYIENGETYVGYGTYDLKVMSQYLKEYFISSAQPDGEYISQQAVTESDLIDWYINSVDESEPVWTEEHIYELFNDFYLIPKENR